MSEDKLKISAWHGTTQKNAENIRHSGFNTGESIDFGRHNLRNPNDLGQGVYFFVDSDYTLGKSMARNYAHSYRDIVAKKQRCKIEVLEAELSMKSSLFLDMDMDSTRKEFVAFVKKHEQQREAIKHRLKNDGANRRKNYDGIMVELFVKKINAQNHEGDVQAVCKETYTSFDGSISNFPNGKEICVRNKQCIDLKERGSGKNGNEFRKFLRSQ